MHFFQGDSGGPLICIFGEEKEEYITGILSKGPPDEGETENTFRPSRFIHIGPLKNWIIQGAHQLMKDSNDKVNNTLFNANFGYAKIIE